MTSLHLLWIGKERSKDPESQLCARYLKRVQPFIKMGETVLKPFGSGDMETVRQKEGERLLGSLDSRDYLIVLDERGKALSSPGLAKLIQEQRERAISRVVFLIGGAMGISAELRQRANFVLSLSQMTLPHAMARAVLMEQIYRALCINASHPYHHEG